MGENYRLGLDLGTNSIGWALLRLDGQGEPCGLLDLGAHIFSNGRTPEKGLPLAANRRVARGMRRRRDRYLQRRRRLQALLSNCGLLPISKDERKALGRQDPYTLRARALDGPLKPYELGRTLFHLNQRRGFKSNRHMGEEDEKQRGEIAERIEKLREQIDPKIPGRRTLGEWLHRHHARGEPVRFRPETATLYPTRSMYEQEFDEIRRAQEQKQTLTPSQWDALRAIIIDQRPLKPVEVGRCTLDPSSPPEPRAHKALPLAQEFRIYQEVNNLRICEPGQRKERPLQENEREIIIEILLSGRDVQFSNLAKKIGIDEKSRINLETEKRKKIDGDATAKELRKKKFFGKRWNQFSSESQNNIVKSLLNKQGSDDELTTTAQHEWGLDREAALKLLHVRLLQGTVHLGETALSRITPELAKGIRYDKAVGRHYQHHSDLSGEGQSRELPYYGEALPRYMMPVRKSDGSSDEQDHGRIGNPTVHIGLNRLRKLVNEIIILYGKPASISIELARDLKNPPEVRRMIEKRQKEDQEKNERRKQEIEDAGGAFTPASKRKIRLWEEQAVGGKKLCIFCGDAISIRQLLSENTEIEHLLPFRRTADDSPANKVVAHIECNRRKGDHSPFEAFGTEASGKYEYSRILNRARNLKDNKAWRFDENAMERYEHGRDFLDRHLNDTRYLSKIAREYLTTICSKGKVDVVTGQLTYMLRGKWGLSTSNLLRDGESSDVRGAKDRTDHRHHAIDALVVALTSRSLVQRVAQCAGRNRATRKTGIDHLFSGLPKPWDGFSHEAIRQRLAKMVVSHRPDHGLAGQLHNKTAYRTIDRIEEGREPFSIDKYQVVTTESLASTKRAPKILSAVRDAGLKEALKELWDSIESTDSEKPTKKWKKFTELAASRGKLEEFGFGGAKHGVRRVRVVEENQTVHPIFHPSSQKGPYKKAVKPDSNAFMDVFKMPNGKWQAVTITRLAANAPDFKKRHNELKPHPAARRIARLFVGDMVAISENGNRHIYRIQQLSGQRVWLSPHNEANAARRNKDRNDPFKLTQKSVNVLRNFSFRKIHVDILGRIRDPGPRS